MKNEIIRIRKDLIKDSDSLKSIDSRLRKLNIEKDKYFDQEFDQLIQSFNLLKLKHEKRIEQLLQSFESGGMKHGSFLSFFQRVLRTSISW